MEEFRINGRSGRAKCHAIITGLREFYKNGDAIPWEDLEHFIEQLCGLDWRTKMKYVACLVKLQFLEPVGRRRRIIIRKPGRMGHVRIYERLGAWEAYKFGLAAPHRYQETLNPKYVPPPAPSPLLKKSEKMKSQKVMRVLCGVGGDSSKHVGEASIDASRRKEEKKKSQRTHILHNLLSQEKMLEHLENEKRRIGQVLKLKDLKGSIIWEKVNCRSPPRKCCPHGPYAYLHYYDSRSGKVRRKYLGKNVELLTCPKTELQEKLRSIEEEERLILGTRKRSEG